MSRLFVLMNHELSEAQTREASERFGVSETIKLANSRWANVPPDLENLDEFLAEFKDALIAAGAGQGDYLLAQGDLGAVYGVVRFALARGVVAIYATTRRDVVEAVENGRVVKKSIFAHERFRVIKE